jgi:sigma-B regulation protein RsbU (phosphoserine phosphatase)
MEKVVMKTVPYEALDGLTGPHPRMIRRQAVEGSEAMQTMPEVIDSPTLDWRERLRLIVTTMREMSRQTDPQEMNRAYRERMRKLRPVDDSLSLSRRDLQYPYYRITRSSRWVEEINPWKDKDRLPLLKGGILADLIYGDEPKMFDDVEIPADDPAAEYLVGCRSMQAIPMYDRGVSLNMVLLLRQEAHAFSREEFPEVVWLTNLFGRVTHNLVLSEQLKTAYVAVDNEMKVVADIQRSLLPAKMPTIPRMDIAASYQTSHRAGGDYYDLFQLPTGLWGLLIADVSGHGTPAAVLMAVTHSLVHTYNGPPMTPGQLLAHINHHLAARYTSHSDTFVTAFYGVYDPADRTLTYASAGHNPPRLKRCIDGSLMQLDAVRGVPLGVFPGETYKEATHRLVPGDQLVLYTDGLTDAYNAAGDMFGVCRLDKALENCNVGADGLLKSVLDAVEAFTEGHPAHDDRTLLVAKIS